MIKNVILKRIMCMYMCIKIGCLKCINNKKFIFSMIMSMY